MAIFSVKKYPTVAASDSTAGSIAWGSPDNVKLADDTYATATVKNGESTRYLKVTGFASAIGTDMRVVGIRVGVDHKNDANKGTGSRKIRARLVMNGAIDATEKESTLIIDAGNDNVEVNDVFGGPSDLWGKEELPIATVNSDTFGVVIRLEKI